MRSVALLVCSAWAAGFALDALGQDAPEPTPQARPSRGEVVRVATSIDYPPYEYVREDGVIEGFNVDVMRAVARATGFELDLLPMPRSDALEGLRSGEIGVLAGVPCSDSRDASIEFSTPLIGLEYSIFVKKGTRDAASAERLSGRSVLVERDSLMHEFLIDAGLDDGIVPVESGSAALRALDAESYDATVIGHRRGLSIAREYGLENVEPAGPPLHSTSLCFAVIEGNRALLDRLDRGLAELRRSGEMQEAYERYFGLMPHSRESDRLSIWTIVSVALAAPALLLAAGAAYAWQTFRT